MKAIISLVILFGQLVTLEGKQDTQHNSRCGRMINGQLTWFCCDNHEERNGICVACKIGYLSEEGFPCRACEGDTYGRKCGEICSCLEYQRCDHIRGCLVVTTSSLDPNSRENSTQTVILTNTQKLTEYDYLLYFEETRTTPTIVTGILEREIIIYSICAACFFVFSISCSMLMWRFQIKNKNSIQSTSTGSHRNQLQIMESGSIRQERTEYAEGVYETINESNMSDLVLQPTETSHHYTNDTQREVVWRQSGDVNIHPYQITVANFDIHDYSLPHLSYESLVSLPESNKSESSYLHPYQPLSSNMEKHEYLSMIDASVNDGLPSLQIEKFLGNQNEPHLYQSENNISLKLHVGPLKNEENSIILNEQNTIFVQINNLKKNNIDKMKPSEKKEMQLKLVRPKSV